MEILKYSVELVKILAWPITILILAFSFRSDLKNLFERIASFKGVGIEASFDKLLSETENEVGNKQILLSDNNDDKFASLYKLAASSPRAAIIETWINIESLLGQIFSEKNMLASGTSERHFLSLAGGRGINILYNEGSITESDFKILQNMRMLRNHASHNIDFDLSVNEAERYIRLAIDIIPTLTKILEPVK